MAHAIELGGTEGPSKPIVFQKPFSSIIHPENKVISIKSSSTIHYEIEMGIMIGKECKNFKVTDDYKDFIGGYFVCLDITDRDMQGTYMKSGKPWTISKSQDGFLPMSEFISPDKVSDPHNLQLSFSVNGERKQFTSTSDLIFQIP